MATAKGPALAKEQLLEKLTEGIVSLNLFKYFETAMFGLLGLMIMIIFLYASSLWSLSNKFETTSQARRTGSEISYVNFIAETKRRKCC